jgi:hypothetical protein
LTVVEFASILTATRRMLWIVQARNLQRRCTGATAMTPRQGALNDALGRIEGVVAFTMDPGFSEHAPMVAEAMSCLGFNDRIAPWIEEAKTRHRHHPPPPPFEPIEQARWQSALGDARRMTDWFAFFRAELGERPWRDVIAVWVPRLIDGFAGGLTHGLVRTSHAVRALPENGEPSVLQRNELARALAYWAGAYRAVAGDPGKTGTLGLAEAVRQLPRAATAGGRSPAVGAALPDSPDLVAVIDQLESTGDVNAALSRHTALFARVLLSHAELPFVPQIQLVHTITSTAAVRTFLPLCPPDFGLRACRRAWHVSASIVARVALAGEDETDPQIAAAPAAGELAARAVEHQDDHVIKLTEVCLREERVCPDPVYRALAAAMQQRVPAWSARGPRPR